jgi:DNA-binding transcriptional regulator YiaG
MNPAHLESGYALENNRDRADRGRSGRMFGTSNPAAKLIMDEVREIRALQGLKTQDELAAAFGVRQSTVSDTLSGRRYPETEAA